MPFPGGGDGFQSFTNILPPKGTPGQFRGANIRANVVGGPYRFLAPASGCQVGIAAWANPVTGLATNYLTSNAALGFVHHAGQGLITNFLGFASMTIPQGLPVTVMNQGSFWGLFTGGGAGGNAVYANPLNGVLTAGASGTGVTVAIPNTASITSSVLTVVSGTGLAANQMLTDAAGLLPEGTYIASGSGTSWTLANLFGTTIPNVAASTTTFTAFGEQQTSFFLETNVVADISQTCSLATPVSPSVFSVMTVANSAVLQPGMWVYSSAGGVPISADIQIIEIISSTSVLVTGSTYSFTSQSASFTQGQLGGISSWSTAWS